MNYRLFLIFSSIFFLFSCSKDLGGKENIVISGKNLNSITHVFYNYVYQDLPATRTFTSNYTLIDNKINSINSKVFHYWHEEPSKNYNAFYDSYFSYDDNNRLVNVEQKSYSERDITDIYVLNFELNYYENDKIKSLIIKNENGVLNSMYNYVYQNKIIKEKYEYFENGNMIFYNEKTYQINAQQRIYRTSFKGPIFENTDPNTITETTQEGSFNEKNNIHQVISNGSAYQEYDYLDVKIPADMPNISLPSHGYIPYHLLMAQFDEIIESQNTNYINSINSLETTSYFIKTFTYKLSKDNYPLNIKVFYNDKIWSETTYNYQK